MTNNMQSVLNNTNTVVVNNERGNENMNDRFDRVTSTFNSYLQNGGDMVKNEWNSKKDIMFMDMISIVNGYFNELAKTNRDTYGPFVNAAVAKNLIAAINNDNARSLTSILTDNAVKTAYNNLEYAAQASQEIFEKRYSAFGQAIHGILFARGKNADAKSNDTFNKFMLDGVLIGYEYKSKKNFSPVTLIQDETGSYKYVYTSRTTGKPTKYLAGVNGNIDDAKLRIGLGEAAWKLLFTKADNTIPHFLGNIGIIHRYTMAFDKELAENIDEAFRNMKKAHISTLSPYVLLVRLNKRFAAIKEKAVLEAKTKEPIESVSKSEKTSAECNTVADSVNDTTDNTLTETVNETHIIKKKFTVGSKKNKTVYDELVRFYSNLCGSGCAEERAKELIQAHGCSDVKAFIESNTIKEYKAIREIIENVINDIKINV